MKHDRIAISNEPGGGRLIIRGTDVPVAEILSSLGNGATCNELLKRHQQLTEDDVRAAYLFAADYVDDFIGAVDWVQA